MSNFKSDKGSNIFIIIFLTILFDVLIILTSKIVNSYEMLVLIRLLFVVFNLYQLYYIVLFGTISYSIEDNEFKITSIFNLKKIIIPLENIKSYNKAAGSIRGVKLTGYGTNSFALGKSMIDKIGKTHMFVTSNENIYYLQTEDGNFGISPSRPKEFEKLLLNKGIRLSDCNDIDNKEIHLHSQRNFILLLSLISIIIIVIIANPIILYLRGKLPSNMPLRFDSMFNPIEYGTSKQFIIKQAVYGVLNMAILFCMYYLSHFYYKYDEKVAYRYLYIALFIAVVFLIMQIKIIIGV